MRWVNGKIHEDLYTNKTKEDKHLVILYKLDCYGFEYIMSCNDQSSPFKDFIEIP